jgi:transcriptional regulator with XRE-family HTH domain
MTFPEKVKAVRRKLYLTQQQLADEVGVDFATINRWENGRRAPKFLLLCKFEDYCKAKGITFDED